jgi:Xaa-Pro aminopeptidase
MNSQTPLPINEIQKALITEKADGWLLYDFRGSNPIARNLTRLGDHIATRRWYYFIPASGDPVKLVHAIEAGNLDHLPGNKIVFRSWQELHASIKKILQGCKKVAMEYSAENDIPYISLVDAGTIEIVRSAGVEIVSSGDLVQLFEAKWTEEQRQSHFEAVRLVDFVKDEGFRFIGDQLRRGNSITEYDAQQFMWELFEKHHLIADHPMIVAVNANASNPHYTPEKSHHSPIRKGDLVLIDIWAKLKKPGAIYGDITWMGYAGSEIPEKMQTIFEIVKGAQRAAFQLISNNYYKGKPTYGWQADEAARQHIAGYGYGDYYLHRTGHNIGQQVHGNGAHLDNLETRDQRKLIEGTGFSIEPGIYLPEFGIRSEIDVYIGPDGPVITSPEQTQINKLL